MSPTALVPGAGEVLEYDESEFFGEDLPAGEPLGETRSEAAAHFGVAAARPDDSDSDSEDGLVISDCSSSDEEDAVEEHLRLRLQSLQSSLNQPTPMEDLGTSHGSRAGSHVGSLKTFGSGPLSRNFGSESDLAAASLPAHASMPYAIQYNHRFPRRASTGDGLASKLGTSMPIGIPLMQRRTLAEVRNLEGGEEEFVPPHLVEQEGVGDMRELFRSVGGLSPNSALKRERLAQRNYIMRATGFLEVAPLTGAAMGEVTDPLRASLLGEGGAAAGSAGGLAIPKPAVQRVATKTSSLSAALGLGTTPQ